MDKQILAGKIIEFDTATGFSNKYHTVKKNVIREGWKEPSARRASFRADAISQRTYGRPCLVDSKSSRVPPVSALRHFVVAEGAVDARGGNRPLPLRPATASRRTATTGRAELANGSW